MAAMFASKLHRKLGFGLCFLSGLVLQSISMALLGLAPSVTTIGLLAVALSLLLLSGASASYRYANKLPRITY